MPHFLLHLTRVLLTLATALIPSAVWAETGATIQADALAQTARRAASNHIDLQVKGPMAFLGDSLTTGAVSHPAQGLGRYKLLDLLRGKQPMTIPEDFAQIQTGLGLQTLDFDQHPYPRRMGPSLSSFSGPLYWVYRNLSHAISHHYLDMEPLSWAYALARQWQVTGTDVIIAANDGARATDAFGQARLLAALPAAEFPRTVFMFFSGNDLCAASRDQYTAAEDYGQDLSRALKLIDRMAADKGVPKVLVVLLEPINVMQLVVNPSIQQKTVLVDERRYRCSEVQQPDFSGPRPTKESAAAKEGVAAPKELRDQDRMLLNFKLLPESPSRYCPGIFMTTEAGEANRAAAATLWSGYRAAIQKVAKTSWGLDHLQILPLGAAAQLLLTGDDIAEDCFHLSYRGQQRLAAQVTTALRKALTDDP